MRRSGTSINTPQPLQASRIIPHCTYDTSTPSFFVILMATYLHLTPSSIHSLSILPIYPRPTVSTRPPPTEQRSSQHNPHLPCPPRPLVSLTSEQVRISGEPTTQARLRVLMVSELEFLKTVHKLILSPAWLLKISDEENDAFETPPSTSISLRSKTGAHGPIDWDHPPQRQSSTRGLSLLWQLNCTISPCTTTVYHIHMHSFIQCCTVDWLCSLFPLQTVKFCTKDNFCCWSIFHATPPWALSSLRKTSIVVKIGERWPPKIDTNNILKLSIIPTFICEIGCTSFLSNLQASKLFFYFCVNLTTFFLIDFALQFSLSTLSQCVVFTNNQQTPYMTPSHRSKVAIIPH